MKNTVLFKTLALAAVWSGFIGSVRGEEAPAAKTGGTTPADFEKATEAISSAMRKVFATIQSETDAKHLNPKEAAAELRRAEELRFVTTAKKVDRWTVENKIQAILQKPPKNPALLQAWNDVNAAAEAYDTLYAQKYPAMVTEAMQSAAKLWREGRDPKEVRRMAEYLKTLESLHWQWVGLERKVIQTPDLTPLAQHMEGYAAFLDAEKMGDPERLSKAVAGLRVFQSPYGELVSVKEIDERRSQIMEGRQRATWAEMLTTVPKATKPEDLIQIADKLQKTALAISSDNDPAHAYDETVRFGTAKEIAVGWRDMLRHETNGEWTEAASKAVELSHQAEKVAPELVAPLQIRIAAAQKQATQTGKVRHEALVRKVGQVLEAVTSVSDVRAALNDPDLATDQAGSGEVHDLVTLHDHLRWLYNVWAMTEIDMPPPLELLQGGANFRHPWTAQTGKIWGIVQRQIIIHQFKPPGSPAAPGNAGPANDPGRDLLNAAEARHDWRQAFGLLRQLNALDPAAAAGQTPAPASTDKDHFDAIKSLLVGDNFAKAEMWSDAIRSYKTALQFLGDPLLTSDAAERLKSLKTQHPELF